MKKYFLNILILVFVFLVTISSSADMLEKCPSDIVLVRGVPNFPGGPLYKSVEGWVRVSAKLSPNATLSDIKVIESEPEGYFERAALKAIEQWEFKWLGSWCAYETKIIFKIGDNT